MSSKEELGAFDDELTPEIVAILTIPQLKQQLRLRGLRVSGKKQELMDRLLSPAAMASTASNEAGAGMEPAREAELLSESESEQIQTVGKTKARQLAEEKGKELVDVTAFLDDEDRGNSVKSWAQVNSDAPVERNVDDNPSSSNPEIWGSEAKIVDDFEGRTPIVDALSRTIVEYRGSNRTNVQAYVVASRDALVPFLAGGRNRTASAPEDRLREIQMKREQEAKRPLRPDDTEGAEEGDETGIFKDILQRDFSDWGKYTPTGAQLSAQEVQGVLLLSDVYGAYTDDTKMLAEKIAFECQPVVVMVPDLFRGNPWKEDTTTPGFNEEGQDFEEWRSGHSDLRVSVDIRAAAAVLREQYGVSSVVVWGTCYGGGRALEIAAGFLPGDQIHDIDGSIGPLPVEPEVAVAWYPTRYNVTSLFGPSKTTSSLVDVDRKRSMAVMAVFAGEDKLEGATPDDALRLRSQLEVDPRVKDYMVKVFPDQDHGFAHRGLGHDLSEDPEMDRFVDEEFGGAGKVSLVGSDAEVACLLSTAFMETYSRMFLPTTGPPVSKDELSAEWSQDLSINQDWKQNRRDVRQEIEESLDNFQEEPLSGARIDPTDDASRDRLAEILRGMEPENVPPALKIQPQDDLEEIYAKLLQSDPSFQIF
jgi:dienelactone hydrolase